MSDFSQLLFDHLHNKNIKTYALAQYCDLDRSNMYKIINGKRKPTSYEMVNKICKFMQLTPSEQKEMEEAYRIALVGADNYYRRKNVLNFFNNFQLPSLQFPASRTAEDEDFFSKDIILLNSQAEINRALLYILSSEFQKDHGMIRLLIQPDHDFLMNILEAADHNNPNIEVDQIICLDNNITQPVSKSNYTLKCLDKILPLYNNSFQYNCYYYHGNVDSKTGEFTLFPYIVITSHYACLLTSDLQQGYLTNTADSIKMFSSIFDRYLKDASPLLRPVNNLQAQLNYMLEISSTMSTAYTFQMVPCMTPYLSPALLDKYLNKDLPDRSEVLKQLNNYIKALIDHHNQDAISYIFSYDGIKQFMETGRINEYPYDIYSPVSMPDRIRIVKHLLLSMQSHNYQMLKNNIGHLDNELYLFVTQQRGYLMLYTAHNHDLIYLEIEEPGLLFTFRDFCETLDEDMFYTQEETISLIQNLIDQHSEE